MLSLPSDLHEAIAHALAKAPAARWQRAAQALSERYRAPRSDYSRALASDADHLLGYAALKVWNEPGMGFFAVVVISGLLVFRVLAATKLEKGKKDSLALASERRGA